LALDHKEYRLAFLSLLYDLSIWIKILFFQIELDLRVKFFIINDIRKIVYLLKDSMLELSPRILVLESLLFHLYQNVWEVAAEVVEHSLVDARHSAVV